MKNSYEMARQNDGEYHFEINEEVMSCHGVSIDKIPTLRSLDTANLPPSKEITGIPRSNQPQQSASTRSTPTQMALSTAGPSPSLERQVPR